ncbi:MAG: ExbD/TolR family protein [Sinimarinibacterium flocculans]|uniref:ExbD/TolR family protein n=1 Tax=Sinimarinibacterium flocculans TaxID=985250 RepID=UPI003AE154BD
MKPIKPDVANLSVTTHGSVFWNDERMGDEQLAQRLQASAPRQPQPEDFIRGDRLVDLRARRPGDGGYAEVRGVGAGLRDRPGHERGEPKDTPMKLHRHARPDAGVSSSAAPIADTSPRARLRACPAHRLIYQRCGRSTLTISIQCPGCVRRPAPRVSATGLFPAGMSASTRCHRRRC